MTGKRILTAILAALLAASSMSVLSSCKKEVEPTKEKRTNVYSGTELALPEGVNYVNQIAYANGNIYVTYYKEYTITYNELGEEVERRVGYYWEEDEVYVDDDMVVEAVPYVEEVVEEVVTEEVIDADGDGVVDTTLEITTVRQPAALTAIAVEVPSTEQTEAEGTSKLPDGWWYGYESVQNICTIPLDGSPITETPLNLEDTEYGWLNNLSIASDGTITATTSQWEYDEAAGMSMPKYYLLTIDPQTGDIATANYFNDAFVEAGMDPANIYVNGVIPASDGSFYVTADSTILQLDADLNYVSVQNLDSGWINRLVSVGDRMLVHYYTDNGGYACKFMENGQLIDVESETLKSVFDNYYGIIGSSAESIYYQMDSGVCRYDFATDTAVEVMNYINSDIDSTSTGNMVVLEDGRIVIASTDWNVSPSVTTLQVLEKVPDEMLAEEIIVRIGTVYTDYNLTRAIIRYNKQNTGIRIAVQSYEHYNNEENQWNGAVQQLNNDIITGKVPDMIYLSTELPVESYFQKGIFADLNEFIDDPEIGLNRADYLTNILEANSTDGKLYSMILSFTLRTLVAESEHVGTEPGWTFEEMMACINAMPEGMKAFFDMGRDNIVDTLFRISLNSFVDWEEGTTQFESQGFIDLIKYLATCPEKGYWDAYYESMGDEYVYDEEKEREMQETYALRYYRDLALFNSAYISSYTDFLYQRNNFASKNITAIGYPTNKEGSNGAIIVPSMEIAISATSSAKNQAWEILKFFMTDEEINSATYRFSINKARNEENKKTASENYYYYESTEDDFAWYRDYGYSEEYITYMMNSNQPFDQEAVDYVQTLVDGAGEIQRTDSDLVDIIKEELSTFFAGTRSAEETARIIASRASIYISENS